jgi:undecaprenyl phosphate-alpha-L-ara4FN deformylase
VDDRVMEIIKSYPFTYLSCTRAKTPFIHEDCRLLELPSDLPCLEEVGEGRFLDTITALLEDGGIHILPSTPKWKVAYGKSLSFCR